MNIDKITKQYNKALEIKKGDKYAETLKLELSKQEWQAAFFTRRYFITQKRF